MSYAIVCEYRGKLKYEKMKQMEQMDKKKYNGELNVQKKVQQKWNNSEVHVKAISVKYGASELNIGSVQWRVKEQTNKIEPKKPLDIVFHEALSNIRMKYAAILETIRTKTESNVLEKRRELLRDELKRETNNQLQLKIKEKLRLIEIKIEPKDVSMLYVNKSMHECVELKDDSSLIHAIRTSIRAGELTAEDEETSANKEQVKSNHVKSLPVVLNVFVNVDAQSIQERFVTSNEMQGDLVSGHIPITEVQCESSFFSGAGSMKIVNRRQTGQGKSSGYNVAKPKLDCSDSFPREVSIIVDEPKLNTVKKMDAFDIVDKSSMNHMPEQGQTQKWNLEKKKEALLKRKKDIENELLRIDEKLKNLNFPF